MLQQGFSHKERGVPAQRTQQCWRDLGLRVAVPHLPTSTWERSSPHTASGHACCCVFPRGIMHTCRGVSVDMQGGVPVEEAVSQRWPISMGAGRSPRLPSATVVLGQPGSPAAAGTSRVCAAGSCAPLVGTGQTSPRLSHQLLHPLPATPQSAHGPSSTPGRAHSSATHGRFVGPFL